MKCPSDISANAGESSRGSERLEGKKIIEEDWKKKEREDLDVIAMKFKDDEVFLLEHDDGRRDRAVWS